MADMTAQQMILDTADFNVEKDFMYTKPKINPSGGKSIGILNSKSKKSKILYHVKNVAALHSQKIGNALLQILKYLLKFQHYFY